MILLPYYDWCLPFSGINWIRNNFTRKIYGITLIFDELTARWQMFEVRFDFSLRDMIGNQFSNACLWSFTMMKSSLLMSFLVFNVIWLLSDWYFFPPYYVSLECRLSGIFFPVMHAIFSKMFYFKKKYVSCNKWVF